MTDAELEGLARGRYLRLDDDQLQSMRAVLSSNAPMRYVRALAGTGKCVMMGLQTWVFGRAQSAASGVA